MIDVKYYCNVARVMGVLPRPRMKCQVLDQDRSETLPELGIVKISGIDGDYYGDKINGLY